MTQTYVIALDKATKTEKELVTESLRGTSHGWWHWMDNVWIVLDGSGVATAVSWRDHIQNLIPETGRRILVLEIEPGAWAGRGPKEGHDWFHENWKSD